MRKSISEIENNLGELADSIDNILEASSLPMPAEFHLKQVKEHMKDWSTKVKNIYIDLFGENPWEVNDEIDRI